MADIGCSEKMETLVFGLSRYQSVIILWYETSKTPHHGNNREINVPNQYPSNGLPIWHGFPDIRPIKVNNG